MTAMKHGIIIIVIILIVIVKRHHHPLYHSQSDYHLIGASNWGLDQVQIQNCCVFEFEAKRPCDTKRQK